MRTQVVTRAAVLLAMLAAGPLAWSQPTTASGAVGGEPLQALAAVQARVQQEPARAARLAKLRQDIQPILARHDSEPDWLVSRLQMYWQARHTQVWVKDSMYDHATGQAPVPTVRFTGSRDTATAYRTPSLVDVKPFMGEDDKLWLQRKDVNNPVWEWAEHSKSGRIIESINRKVIETARDAAFLYWYEGNQTAAKVAFSVLDAYLNGIFYRALPKDLRNGHDQNIVGLQSYEVIHEEVLMPLTEAYALLGGYVDAQGDGKRARFDAALKQWADVLLLNGVPWNNWNLIKAKFVLQIASVLKDDSGYPDARGRQYYVQSVIDGNGPRHWGLQRLLNFGYDAKSAMWNESASYATLVFDELVECLDLLDRVFGIDMLERMPMLLRAAEALPQYMLPNGRKVGFGDTRYDLFHTQGVERLAAYAQRRGRADQAQQLQRVLGALRAAGAVSAAEAAKPVHAILAATQTSQPIADVPVWALQSPTYYSANTSWLIQRNGYAGPDARDEALVVSLAGANGNHAHANGLAMELFAKGLSLAPESGRGSGYFQKDYAEYYSQFPAHNTVVVDGISAYPAMKVEQPFKLLAVTPAPGAPLAAGDPNFTMAEVDFVEPASQADQRRLLATVRVGERQAYVVDVFRSRRRAGGDRYHDYILHGFGQQMGFMQAGRALPTAPTSKLSFADGDLHGYEYWYDKQSLVQDGPLQARFALEMPDRKLVLQAWLQGGKGREFFSLKAPPSTAWPRGMLPAGLDQLPSPTLVIRQTGPAWDRPFAVVLEARRDAEASVVEQVRELPMTSGAAASVGLDIGLTEQRRHLVLSNSVSEKALTVSGARLDGRMGLVGTRAGRLERLHLADGRALSALGATVACVSRRCAASVWQRDGRWHYAADARVRVTLPGQAAVVRQAAGASPLF